MNRKILFFLLLTSSLNNASQLNEGIDFTQKKETPSSGNIYDQKHKRYHLGWFDKPFTTIDLGNCFQELREKKWHYFSCASQDYVIGMAVVEAQYFSNFFLYVFDVHTKQLVEFDDTDLLIQTDAHINDNSVIGKTTYSSKGFNVEIKNELAEHKHTIFLECSDKNNKLTGYVEVFEEGQPLVNSRQVGSDRIVYTHQNSMYRPKGLVVLNNKQILFDPQTDFATMDFTRGMHDYKTAWNWAAAGGFATDGAPIAINIAKDIGKGSNTVPVYWIDGNIYRTSNVFFSYTNINKVWFITSPDGKINLKFKPISKREKDINALLLQTTYIQPIGYFSGSVADAQGKKYYITDMIGIAEEHVAKW